VEKRLLVVNLHFAPHRFGGGTVVAEACARALQGQHGWRVLVLTAIRDFNLPEYSLRRYRVDGLDVVAVVINSERDYLTDYCNPRFDLIARQIVATFQPDVCHVHALQGLGVGWFDSLREARARLAVTLHDCWWLCERQFMINSDGVYCNQSAVSPEQCRYCTVQFDRLLERRDALFAAVSTADLLLYPSAFHRHLHVASGMDPEKSRVNRNGITLPAADFGEKQGAQRGRGRAAVFGFTGGPGEIKGAALIVRALEECRQEDYLLKVVDSAQNLGTTSMDDFFAGIDVLLFPSQWKESFGLTVREALARDIWVIATDCGAPVEDIVPGENGTVIPFEATHAELRIAIEQAIGRDWRTYSNPYRERLRSFDQQAAELSAMLEEVL
jgi:glycosyltransferase involved in cell wall biosynthesis